MYNISEDMLMPWPQCLGSFDEESCRYFLYEVGKRIVPNYPFSFGMEEVYGLILERYGYEGTPDVTSLLQELLEDDHNATGVGDDGDVWRSWRHCWRHRNDDARNPFIPRFGALVLRPSATPRMRLLRANNFIKQFDRWCKTDAEHPNRPHDDRKTFSPQPARCGAAIMSGVVEDMDRTSIEAVDVRDHSYDRTVEDPQPQSCFTSPTNGLLPLQFGYRSSAPALDANLSLPSGLLECPRHSAAQLRGGSMNDEAFLVIEPHKSLENRALCSSSIHISSSDAEDRTGSLREAGLNINQCWLKSNSESRKSGEYSEHNRQCSEDDSEWGINNISVLPGVGLVTTSPSSDKQPLPSNLEDRKRAVHRQARLIDGTIFTSRARRSKTIGQVPVVLPDILNSSDKRSSARLSWSPAQRRTSLRKNITNEIGRLFHGEKKDKLSHTTLKYRSVPGLCRINTLRPFSNVSMASNQCRHTSPEKISRPAHGLLGLDGTSDRPAVGYHSIDLNKPLPLSPEEIVKSMSCRSQQTISQYSDDTSNLPSTASTTSSVSKGSNRQDFRDKTTGLLQASMLTPHELPPIHEVDTTSHDVVDPPKSPVPPASPVSYTSFARSNPFIDKKPTRSPIKPPPLDLNSLCKEKDIFKDEDSNESPAADYLVATSTRKQVQNYFPPVSWSKGGFDGHYHEENLLHRGRSLRSPDVSQHAKPDTLPPKTPTKRSRSPIKRFLGLTKSSSTNKIEDVDLPSRPKTPKSGTKDSLKKWGDRFRYGFLTPDEEQLRQEELIEAHQNNDLTTSTPQNSTFPISLEPPVQAKIQSEIELIMTVTANRYLLRESRAGRISAESVAKIKELWEKMNRPQVVEFHYDQLTQHNLVMANLDRVKLYGDAAKDAIAINSTMRGWKIMAREMSIRTFCSPDSVIRKHLHDAHRVLELLGAPVVTFLAYEDMQLKTLSKISQRQKERMGRRAGSADRNFSLSSTANMMMAVHRRNASEGSYHPQQHDYTDYPITSLQMDKISLSPSPTPLSGKKVRKATGAEGVIMSLPTNLERSRNEYTSRLNAAKTGMTMKEI